MFSTIILLALMSCAGFQEISKYGALHIDVVNCIGLPELYCQIVDRFSNDRVNTKYIKIVFDDIYERAHVRGDKDNANLISSKLSPSSLE